MVDLRTEDKLLGGRVTLRQLEKGYRVAIDPVLLAAAVPAKADERVLELGCGTGAAFLCLNARVAGLQLAALERDATMLALARENAVLNNVAIDFYEGAVGADNRLPVGAYDHVMFNPPFHGSGGFDASPHATRNAAHRLDGGLDLWINQARKALKVGGTATMILDASQMGAALAALQTGFGAIIVLPLWPHAGQAAKRIIIQAKSGRRTPLVLLPGLVLHEAGGVYSAAAEAILRAAERLVLA